LFVCDRDELRAQGLAAFQNLFGADAAEVSGGNPHKNARILVATYQTLEVDRDDADSNFLLANYPENYFSHIIIDECHRSAWGKWSQVLTRNPNAVQVGLTATPRQLTTTTTEKTPEARTDAQITADNYKWFGEPVYEYDMAQGIEDGYLAACEVHRFDLFLDNKAASERETGVARDDLDGKVLTDADTGVPLQVSEAREHYEAPSLEDRLLVPERVEAMCRSLFDQLLVGGGPEQKTIIFCARDRHADDVAAQLNNLYAEWCAREGRPRAEPYAFKCTAASGGGEYLADLRGASRRHFIATTVDLLTTGVDVPCVRNIVFFKYVRSPIAFYQMVGRGTRLYPPDGKLMFRVYDYTDATRLFGEEFITTHKPPRERAPGGEPAEPPERILRVEGFEVHVTDAGRYVITDVDGKAMPVTVEEYKQRLAQRLVAEAPTLEDFRIKWVTPPVRHELLAGLPDAGRSVLLIRDLEDMREFDLYDVLAELGYGQAPKTRAERAGAFAYKHAGWLGGMSKEASAVIRAIAGQFALAGTEGLENPAVFDTPQVRTAGGLAALRAMGRPADLLMETKSRMLAA
jgi:type I restriction enzyme R subunit